jgi:Flp pilus assembly protein TadB
VQTRGDFQRQAATARAAERGSGTWLVTASVGLGVAQLLFLRWAGRHLDRPLATQVALGFFVAYAAIVGWLLARLLRQRRRSRPRCPYCGRSFDELSIRIVTASGRCDGCGLEVCA